MFIDKIMRAKKLQIKQVQVKIKNEAQKIIKDEVNRLQAVLITEFLDLVIQANEF